LPWAKAAVEQAGKSMVATDAVVEKIKAEILSGLKVNGKTILKMNLNE
jgi:hypothetical protein